MGNAALRDIAAITEVQIEDLGDSVVAIDAHNWLYKYLTTTVKFTDSSAYTTDNGTEVANLIGVVQGLPTLLEADLVPIFVFDGSPTDLKADEIESRREAREDAQSQLEQARERGDEVAIARLESRTQRLTPTIQETTRELFDRLDVPYVEAPMEGEGQAAHMARHDADVDYVATDDYDALLFGAPETIRQLTSSGDSERMDLAATLSNVELTWEQLVDAAILAGTDFNEGLDGVGVKTAVTEVRTNGDLASVLAARDASIPNAERLQDLFLRPTVTEEYDVSTTISPDLDAARGYVTDEWGIPDSEVSRGFERIDAAVGQTGLDRWT